MIEPSKRSLRVECSVKLEVKPGLLEPILKALRPETLSLPSKRVAVTIDRVEDKLVLTFKAKDLTAFRAALNSYLRWFSAIQKTLELV
ncbi:hypothetical protein J7L70_06740 [Candidatus Bathyarchaeota archaeon]|nr:hypothetical protein [Candidatus Bathyarchaeota archaeon]